MKLFEGSIREVAKQHGVKTYYNGKPCRRGHNSPRYTASGQCVECMRIYNNGSRYRGPREQVLMVRVPTQEAAFRLFLFAQELEREYQKAGEEAVVRHHKLMQQRLDDEQRQHLAEFHSHLSTR